MKPKNDNECAICGKKEWEHCGRGNRNPTVRDHLFSSGKAKGSERLVTRSGSGAIHDLNRAGNLKTDKSPQQRGNAGDSSHIKTPTKAHNSEPAKQPPADKCICWHDGRKRECFGIEPNDCPYPSKRLKERIAELDEEIARLKEKSLKQVNELKLSEMFRLIKEIQDSHRWYIQRGGMLPYDWSEYMGKRLYDLEHLAKQAQKHLKKEE